MANNGRDNFARGSRRVFGGELVIYETGSGKKIVARKPSFDDNLTYTENQTMRDAALRDAAMYASFAESQEDYIQIAEQTGSTAYALAVADWYGAPKVLEINLDDWTGQPGETIRVKARDNVLVARVTLMIRDHDSQLVEMGEAVHSEAGGLWWTYTTQSQVSLTPFPHVQAIAFDLPGNRDSFTVS
jgi:hypothetical protein